MMNVDKSAHVRSVIISKGHTAGRAIGSMVLDAFISRGLITFVSVQQNTDCCTFDKCFLVCDLVGIKDYLLKCPYIGWLRQRNFDHPRNEIDQARRVVVLRCCMYWASRGNFNGRFVGWQQ